MGNETEERKALGLPPTFTVDDLIRGFDPVEIAALAEGDDPLITDLPDEYKLAPKQPSALKVAKGWVDEESTTPTAEDNDDDDPAPRDPAVDYPDDDDDAPGAAGEDAGDGAPDGDDPAKAAGQTPEAVLPDILAEPEPELIFTPTVELEKQVAEFDDKLVALGQEFEDGDITQSEFNAKMKELARDQAKLESQIATAKSENERSLEASNQTWAKKVNAFCDANPAFVATTPIGSMKDAPRDVFDQSLQYVTANAANLGAATMADQIRLASEMTNRFVFLQTGQHIAAIAPAADPSKKDQKPGPRKDPRPAPVQTLGKVTTVAETEPGENRWRHIDDIEDPIAREKALDRLSESERDDYLKG